MALDLDFVCMSCQDEAKENKRQCEKCGSFFCIVPMVRSKSSTKNVGTEDLLKNTAEGKEIEQFEFLGKLPDSFSFVVYGDPGAGKSRVCLLLAGNLPGKTLYISSEQEIYSGSFRNMVKFAKEHSCKGLDINFSNAYTKEELIESCSGYDNVIIDSLSAINGMVQKKQEKFGVGDLREMKSRLKILGYLLHSTKKRSYQGETWLTHEPDIVLKVKRFAKVFTTKNRFDENKSIKLFQ